MLCDDTLSVICRYSNCTVL